MAFVSKDKSDKSVGPTCFLFKQVQYMYTPAIGCDHVEETMGSGGVEGTNERSTIFVKIL